MKLLKITGIVFVVTIVLSSLGVNAETYLTFAGITISGHSTQYTSSQCEKTMTSEQYYKHRSAYDTLTGVLRNLDIRIVDSGTSQETAWKEFEQGDLKSFSDSFVKDVGKYKLRIRTSNIFSNDVYINGIWYLNSADVVA